MFKKMSKLLKGWQDSYKALHKFNKVNSEPASCTPHVFYAHGHKVVWTTLTCDSTWERGPICKIKNVQ